MSDATHSGTAEAPDPAIVRFVRRCGLVPEGAAARFVALTGGVSSDIWLVRWDGGAICVKRALARLRVASDWRAPVERNAKEAAWLRTVHAILPHAAPVVLAEDAAAGAFAMDYLDPAAYPVWKDELRRGIVMPETAEEVARRLALIHARTAGSDDIARAFSTDATFHAIRLEPYLLATAAAHPDLAEALGRLAAVTAETKRCLVHGDVSPKNILVGSRGPLFIDAECAWYGDPAFDLAFCLNHLLLKCLWTPPTAPRYLDAFGRLSETYLAGVDWEDAHALESRTARLIPGLFLARIDGRSPVEYITDTDAKESVRRVARHLLIRPPDGLRDIREAWADEIRATDGVTE